MDPQSRNWAVDDYVTLRFDDAGELLGSHRLGSAIIPSKTDDSWIPSLIPGALLYWPSFPLQPMDQHGVRVRRDGEMFRVDAPLGENPESKVDQLRAQQQWERGRPWYEFMRVDSVSEVDEGQRPRVEFMEQVVQWDSPKEAEQ